MDDRLYLRQIRMGRDAAKSDRAADQMQNFVYLIGDRVAGRCLVVDPAWDIAGIADLAAEDGMTIEGALVTHYHPDHIGGSIFGLQIQGLRELIGQNPCKIHVHKLEADGVLAVTGLSKSDLTLHEGNDKVAVGSVEIELLHTPGHTPGSQCFRVGQSLVSGDTLFLRGCGRTDLPGGDHDALMRTISERLSRLPDDLDLYPGHAYDGPSERLGEVKVKNPIMRALKTRSPSP